jgi:hypothetical protein
MSLELSINTLNSFLRDEIAAVEIYRQALRRLQSEESIDEVRACMRSHEKRVATLSLQVRQLGGAPAQRPTVWDAFAGLLDPEALGTNDGAAIAALEETEDHGLKLYLDDVSKLDRESRKLIEREVLPEQMRTHDSLSDLKLTYPED